MIYPAMKAQRGFTLVELMIAIAIVAILAAIAVPSMQSITANRKASKLSHELQIDIMYARNQAMTFNRTIAITPKGGDWASGWQIKQGNDLLRENNPNARTGEISSQAMLIEFNRNGVLSSGDAQIRIEVDNCKGNRVRTISVTKLGQITTGVSSC